MKKIATPIVLSILLVAFALGVAAQTTTAPLSQQELIQKLKQQIATLQVQIEALIQAQLKVKGTVQEIRQTLQLAKQLRRGMSGDDVKRLQEILSTDPEVYPEKLVTGFFGPATERAVKRLQKLMGVEQVGNVGPKTLSKLNEILQGGAGESGKVPPGLLIAPGIRKKLGFAPQPLPGQVLPPGIGKKLGTSTAATTTPGTTTPDTAAPVISDVEAKNIASTSVKIEWKTNEIADSKLWYSTSTPVVVATSTPQVSSSDLVLNHQLSISGLTASTNYYYLVSSADSSGNTATGTEKSFTTLSGTGY